VKSLEEQYNRDIQQESFAMLVAARVNDILSNKAEALNFQHHTPEQENLIFADVIARAVCAHLPTGKESSE